MTDVLYVTHLNKCMIISHGEECKVVGKARQIIVD